MLNEGGSIGICQFSIIFSLRASTRSGSKAGGHILAAGQRRRCRASSQDRDYKENENSKNLSATQKTVYHSSLPRAVMPIVLSMITKLYKN